MILKRLHIYNRRITSILKIRILYYVLSILSTAISDQVEVSCPTLPFYNITISQVLRKTHYNIKLKQQLSENKSETAINISIIPFIPCIIDLGTDDNCGHVEQSRRRRRQRCRSPRVLFRRTLEKTFRHVQRTDGHRSWSV